MVDDRLRPLRGLPLLIQSTADDGFYLFDEPKGIAPINHRGSPLFGFAEPEQVVVRVSVGQATPGNETPERNAGSERDVMSGPQEPFSESNERLEVAAAAESQNRDLHWRGPRSTLLVTQVA